MVSFNLIAEAALVIAFAAVSVILAAVYSPVAPTFWRMVFPRPAPWWRATPLRAGFVALVLSLIIADYAGRIDSALDASTGVAFVLFLLMCAVTAGVIHMLNALAPWGTPDA
jgi:hypothetical protein